MNHDCVDRTLARSVPASSRCNWMLLADHFMFAWVEVAYYKKLHCAEAQRLMRLVVYIW